MMTKMKHLLNSETGIAIVEKAIDKFDGRFGEAICNILNSINEDKNAIDNARRILGILLNGNLSGFYHNSCILTKSMEYYFIDKLTDQIKKTVMHLFKTPSILNLLLAFTRVQKEKFSDNAEDGIGENNDVDRRTPVAIELIRYVDILDDPFKLQVLSFIGKCLAKKTLAIHKCYNILGESLKKVYIIIWAEKLFWRLKKDTRPEVRNAAIKEFDVIPEELMKIDTGFYSKNITPTYDSDAIDRLRYFATVVILTSCTFFIMAKQYVGQSIQCWMPKQFKGGWEQYAETYCLIENTYFVNMNETNLPTEEIRKNKELRYYQWVPFILFGLALVLYIPRVVWLALQSVIGINISIVTSHLRKNAKGGFTSEDEDIEKKRKQMQYKKKVVNKQIDGEFWGSRLTVCLLTTKVLATVVILVSMGFMDYFMGMGPFYGWTVTKDVLQGRQWQESGTFPRVTFCDFQVRELGYVNNWSLQCVLMVNMFNEKLFIALWWWYVVLAVLSIYDIFRFIFRFTVHHQVSFISSILSCTGDTDITKTEVGEFNRKVLRIDGINLTHLVYANATIFEASEFLKPLWHNFKTKQN